jgi:hypothetical protein
VTADDVIARLRALVAAEEQRYEEVWIADAKLLLARIDALEKVAEAADPHFHNSPSGLATIARDESCSLCIALVALRDHEAKIRARGVKP